MKALGKILSLFFLFFTALGFAESPDSQKIRQTLFMADGHLSAFLEALPPSQLFPEATHYGELKNNYVEIYRQQELLGYAVLNSDFVNTNGYSGKPIHILLALDKSFTIKNAQLVKHSEPIVLIGIPIEKVNAYIDAYQNRNYSDGNLNQPAPDVISGATVTVMVINETIARTAYLFAKQFNQSQEKVVVPEFIQEVNREKETIYSWDELINQSAISHLNLSVGQVNQLFADHNYLEASKRSESASPEAIFIDFYFAPVSVPSIGKSLLGENTYQSLKKRLKPNQEALLVMGNGLYSFKGSGYVRGGLFDRLKIKQEGESFHFRDIHHTRLADVLAKGAPRFKEVALFIVPEGSILNLTQSFQAELLIQRAIASTDKSFITVETNYSLPETYLIQHKNPDYVPPVENQKTAEKSASEALGEDNLQAKIAKETWQKKTGQILVLAIALFVLFAVFMLQEIITAHPVFYRRFRIVYLCFTLFWLGGYLGAQLSVVNVLTFTHSFMNHFDWHYFLMDPMIFILWSATAFGTLMWNRGTFCGWLCPFGALQELSNQLGRKFGIKQWKIPFKVHERLTAVKYILFLLLFGFSLYDLALAEQFAEIEPFKTTMILKFNREWFYVLFALILIFLGLFVERFYCRYLCPLGAGLAIPAKLRLFNWLKRYPECGNPCQKCAQDCPVEAIFPEGHINENECIQCLNCQVLYHDKQRCLHLLLVENKKQKALDREKRIEAIKNNREALS